MSKKLFPASKGWITANLTLKRDITVTKAEAREFISFGKPHRIQLGSITYPRHRHVKVIYRELNKAAVDPDTQPVAVDFDIHRPVPFIAQCGTLIVEVEEVFMEHPPMIRAEILQGKHFNDDGNYGPGDTVNIGPLSERWKILTFPDTNPNPQEA